MFIRRLSQELGVVVAILAVVFSVFFYKVILFHQVPFPGDLLIASAPFKTESYLGYAPGGYPNKAQGRDVIAQLYPWKYFSISEMKQGNIPFWNPHNFSGNILMQNYQSGVFYPFNIIFFFLPFVTSWTIFILLQPMLACIFMYLFLRSLKLHHISSLLGAVGFAFSSYMTVWLEWGNIDHTILWLPLVLFSIVKLFEKVRVRWFVLLIVAMVCCLFAGYIQGAFYIAFLAFCFAEFLFFQNKKPIAIWSTAIGFFCAVCIGAIMLLPTLSFLEDSTRGAYSLSQIQNLLNPWYYLVTLFASDFFGNPATRNFVLPITYFERVMYIGVPLFFFAWYSLTDWKNKIIQFFAVVCGITLFLTLNVPGVSYFYLIPIPVLSTTVPTRLLSIFIFCAVVLAAFGMEAWIKEKKIKMVVPLLFLAVYVLLWLSVFILPKIIPGLAPLLTVSKHNLVLPTLLAFGTIFGFFLKHKLKWAAIAIVSFLIMIDLFYSFQKFTPFSPASLMFPETPVVHYLQTYAGINRYWGYGSAYIPANYQTVDGTYSADGYDSLFIREYGALLNSSAKRKISQPLSRTDANIAPGYGPTDLSQNAYRQKIVDLLGVKYILNLDYGLTNKPEQTGTFPHETYQLVWQQAPWQIYENKKALPRYFLTPSDIVIPDAAKALSAIYTTDLSKTLILSQKPQQIPDITATGSVQLVTYKPTHILFKTVTTGTEFLFLSDTYYKDWHVSIDGKEALLYKADYAFRAVEIPQGTHEIHFFYNPPSFILGLLIAGMGIFIIFLGSWYIYKQKFLA